MPPEPPPLPRKQRFTPTPGRPNASFTREKAMSEETPQLEVTGQLTGNKSLAQILKQLATNRLENVDIVIPSSLVDIVLALSFLMEETTLKLNAMETQLWASSEATKRLDRIEKQLLELTKQRNVIPPQTTQTVPADG